MKAVRRCGKGAGHEIFPRATVTETRAILVGNSCISPLWAICSLPSNTRVPPDEEGDVGRFYYEA